MHLDSGDTGITNRSAAAVEGDDVPRVRVCAAYGVIVTVNQYALPVAQRLCACDIGSDDVTLDEVAGTVGSEKHSIGTIIARDQIAGRRTGGSCQAADHSIRDETIEVQANVRITEGDCACDIRANKVALHGIRIAAPHVNAAVVRRYDVAGINGGAADDFI